MSSILQPNKEKDVNFVYTFNWGREWIHEASN